MSACSPTRTRCSCSVSITMLTEQEASPRRSRRSAAGSRARDTCLVLGPHHDVGISADLEERAMEYAHHGDALVPRQQRFGKYTRSLMKGLGVPVENRYGLRPGVVKGTTQIAPLTINRDLDTRGWLEGVTNFSFHKHLPHYAVTRRSRDRRSTCSAASRSICRGRIRSPRQGTGVQLVRLDAAGRRAGRRGPARRLDRLQHAVRGRREPEALLEEPRDGAMISGGADSRSWRCCSSTAT